MLAKMRVAILMNGVEQVGEDGIRKEQGDGEPEQKTEEMR